MAGQNFRRRFHCHQNGQSQRNVRAEGEFKSFHGREREREGGGGGVYSMQSDVILIFEFALTGLNQRGKEEGILFVLSVVLFQNTATVHCGQTDSHRIHTWPAHGIETRSGESELESD